jgi:hypothetical protein
MTLRDTTHTAPPRADRTGAALMLVAGIAFFVGDGLHPKGTNEGDKLAQLHSMLVDDLWYPAHAVFLLAMACFAAGLLAIRRQSGLGAAMTRVLNLAAGASVLATLAMLVHLFAATQASAIAHGQTTGWIRFHTLNETIVNPLWALSIVALAVVGGLSRTLGNRIVMVLGAIGGLAFALATATIAFTDTFDALFLVSSLIGIWGAAVGVIGLIRAR